MSAGGEWQKQSKIRLTFGINHDRWANEFVATGQIQPINRANTMVDGCVKIMKK